tara:strand:+ start:4059 stop:4322 length:264 start_codon:yes stop_codon:yes gene_type:complete
LNEFRRERVIHSFFFRKITHKKKKKKRREINWSKKFGRQHTKTHKKKKFSTRFFVVRKNVQMNKKYVLKKFHKVGKGGKKWWWWWWW